MNDAPPSDSSPSLSYTYFVSKPSLTLSDEPRLSCSSLFNAKSLDLLMARDKKRPCISEKPKSRTSSSSAKCTFGAVRDHLIWCRYPGKWGQAARWQYSK